MSELNPEIGAISAVYEAVKSLEPDVQRRVLNYVASMLKTGAPILDAGSPREERFEPKEERLDDETHAGSEALSEDDGLEGVSPIAKKWMTRNGLGAAGMSQIFSIGGEEIDLVAHTIPGDSKRDRMHSVLLLRGVAAYLGSGAARFTHEQLKQTCVHYDAYDLANFAKHLKAFAAEVTGEKGTGYTLLPRGLANASILLKGMLKEG